MIRDPQVSGITAAEKLARLRLARAEGVGPVTFRQLLDRFTTAVAAIAALPRLAASTGRGRRLRLPSLDEVEAEAARLATIGGRMVVMGERDYPGLLAQIADAPPVLSVLGDPSALNRALVAIVGSRQASLAGRTIARLLAEGLGKAGYGVVSGLARGIDGVGHAAALSSGTIAVLAGGVDVVYPREHQALYEEVVAQGAVVSELPLGVAPQARHFPRRNRIIAGLSLGVVVIEAHRRSGSLITAQCALEQGREVFAVPGSPLDPRARGCNQLIRDGATLIESAEDIVTVLAHSPLRRIGEGTQIKRQERLDRSAPRAIPPPPVAAMPAATPGADADVLARTLRESLSPTPVAVDELVRSCQLSPAVVNAILLEWELAGRLIRHSGNRVSLSPSSDRMDP